MCHEPIILSCFVNGFSLKPIHIDWYLLYMIYIKTGFDLTVGLHLIERGFVVKRLYYVLLVIVLLTIGQRNNVNAAVTSALPAEVNKNTIGMNYIYPCVEKNGIFFINRDGEKSYIMFYDVTAKNLLKVYTIDFSIASIY